MSKYEQLHRATVQALAVLNKKINVLTAKVRQLEKGK
jgi:hypothetical protein